MKKLIIGIGFTALMAVTGLQAETPARKLTNEEKFAQFDAGMAKLDEWVAQHPGKNIPVASFQTMAKFSPWPQGQAILQKYQRVNDLFANYQAMQANSVSSLIPTNAQSVKACAQVISKLPKEAQKSFLAKFREYCIEHRAGINRATMIAVFLAGGYLLYQNDCLPDYAKTTIDSALSFVTQTVPSYVSSAWGFTKNALSGIFKSNNNIQPTFSYAACAANDPCLKTAQSWLQGNGSALATAQTQLQNAQATLDRTPTLAQASWWEKIIYPGTKAIQQNLFTARSNVISAENGINEVTQGLDSTERFATQCSTIWR